MIPDFTAIVVAHLADDDLIDAPVYGQRFPEGTVTWPAIRASTLSVTNLSDPAPSWWQALVQVDVLAATDAEGWQIVDAVQRSLTDLIGQVPGASVIDSKSAGVQFVDDQGFKPPVGRWIVSVMVTARETAGGS